MKKPQKANGELDIIFMLLLMKILFIIMMMRETQKFNSEHMIPVLMITWIVKMMPMNNK